MATLGEFLRSVRYNMNRSLSDISSRAKELSEERKLDNDRIGKSVTYFSKIETNEIKVRQEYLRSLSQIYQTDVLLLSSFFRSVETDVVRLSKDEDYREVFFNGEELQRCKTEETDHAYKLPRFRLANSSLLLLFTTIEPGSARPPHTHEGEEIVKCESGEGIVVFPDASSEEKEKPIRIGQIIHFDARRRHFIENRSPEPASFLVIRLLLSSS